MMARRPPVFSLRSAVLALLAGSLSLAAACNNVTNGGDRACTLEARAGINVTVVDDATGAAITNGSGVAREGTFVEQLQSFGGQLGGAYEREGTYDVSVTAPGYQTWLREDVTVGADECHVIPVRLTARLVRAS